MRLLQLYQQREELQHIALTLQNFLGVDSLTGTCFWEVTEAIEQLDYQIQIEQEKIAYIN